MIILGVDPGLALLGYGVIEANGSKLSMLEYGTIVTTPDSTLAERLVLLHTGVRSLIEQYKPDAAAFEELFFSANTKTAIQVAQARGTALAAAAMEVRDIFEFTPMQVKQAVVGYGRAEKQQVQQMVKMILNLESIPKPDDAADALAVAICCAQTRGLNELYKVR